jgi:hypothetical protein
MLTPETIKKTNNWINTNKRLFPKTLDGETMYYNDVVFTAEIWLTQLEAKDIGTQMTAYAKLKQLLRDLEVKENWNKPLATIDDLK